jgi:hypothetical protein
MSEENNAVDSQVSAETTNLDQGISEATETEELLSSDENSEEALPAESDGEKKNAWSKVQERINELTKEKHEARRLAERYEKMLDQLATQQQKAPEPVAPGIQPPNPNDFAGGQYDPRYMDAMLQYTRESAVIEARQAAVYEYEQRAKIERETQAHARLEAAEAATKAKFADYDSVIAGITSDPTLAQNPVIRQALLGLDNGPEIAYTLGKNLDVAYEISQMNPIQAGMRLAEIINRAPRKTSNAPTPIRPIGTTGANPAKTLYEMSPAEFIAARNAEERAKREARIKR